MKHNSTHTMGAFHPAIFMLVVYAISLTMSIFICRIVFFSTHRENVTLEQAPPLKEPLAGVME